MRANRIAIAIATVALSFQAADALAFDCYEVIDKDQNVVFRATRPPFPMDGEEWKKGQDELRAKSHHLRWQFATDCTPQIIPVGRPEGATQKADAVFDPNVILRTTPEYMTASGRPTPMMSGGR
jgi:hypothetical protein